MYGRGFDNSAVHQEALFCTRGGRRTKKAGKKREWEGWRREENEGGRKKEREEGRGGGNRKNPRSRGGLCTGV